MKNRYSKTLKNILFILILIILFLIIQSTYSKYIQKDDKTTKFDISGWKILINGIDITEKNNNFSDNLELKFESNKHISDNVIVPTSIGYFDIEIDSTGTKLPFKYDISLMESSIDDFKIISYKLDDGDEQKVTSDMKSITGEIDPSEIIDAEVKHKLTFYVQWYDQDSSSPKYDSLTEQEKDSLDNYGDVRASKSQADMITTIPVNVKVTQITK